MPRFSRADYLAYLARRGESCIHAGPESTRESEIHNAVIAECNRLGLYYVHSRMDKPSTTLVGTPDFVVALPNGRTLWLEAKAKDGKLRQEQACAMAWLKKLGHDFRIVTSEEQAIRVLNEATKQTETDNDKPDNAKVGDT